MKHVIGFDLGGTKMVSSVVSPNGKISGRAKNKTDAQEGQDKVFSRIVETIRGAAEKADIKMSDIGGIGIAVPGPIDFENGLIVGTPNLAFYNFPIRAKLEEAFDMPVFMENDVNAGTYGEYLLGAAKGYSHVIGMFPGTGLGGGLILNGELYRGATGNAGELGHMIIQIDGPLCGCGRHGCLEALASKTALAKEAIAMAASGKAQVLLENAGTDFKNYKSKVFSKSWDAEEPEVVGIIERGARFLGIGMANIVNIFSPEVIILGGGLVEKLGKPYLNMADKAMREHAMPPLAERVKVLEAELGDDAVLLGAASLIRREIDD